MTTYQATLGWIDGVLEGETIQQAAERAAQRHRIDLISVVPDPFNHGCALVTYESAHLYRLVALYKSDDGGGLSVEQACELIKEVAK